MELIEIIKEVASVCVVLATIGGGIAVIKKLLDWYSAKQRFKEKCEGYEAQIKKANDDVEETHRFTKETLDLMNAETDAKLQQIRAEQEMITYCMRAVLDGLHQLNCNGPVTEASKKLDEYLNAQAHN